jgi:hypothetical protein
MTSEKNMRTPKSLHIFFGIRIYAAPALRICVYKIFVYTLRSSNQNRAHCNCAHLDFNLQELRAPGWICSHAPGWICSHPNSIVDRSLAVSVERVESFIVVVRLV